MVWFGSLSNLNLGDIRGVSPHQFGFFCCCWFFGVVLIWNELLSLKKSTFIFLEVKMTDCRADQPDHLKITQVEWFLLLSSLASQAGQNRTNRLGVSAVSAMWLTALCLPLLPRFLPLSFWHTWPPSPALLPRRGEVCLWLWCPCEIPGDHMSHGGDERGLGFAGHSQAFHLREHAHTHTRTHMHGNLHDRSSQRCMCLHHTGKSMQNKKNTN